MSSMVRMEVSEAYVLGLLAEVEPAVPALAQKLTMAQTRATAVDAELAQLLRRLVEANAARETAATRGQKAATALTENNMRVASLHQEIASLKRRSDDIKLEMDRVGPGAIFDRLRRERAKLLVQAEDREAQIKGLRAQVEAVRQDLQAAEAAGGEAQERARAVGVELDRLQEQLPRPDLYESLALHLMARAHCRLFLDRKPEAWVREIQEAVGWVVRLQRDVRAGKYRLDKHSDIVGGRSTATAEAAYAAVATGNPVAARELFLLATDPSLFFHQIFNVFRLWCLGLYLDRRHAELRELLRLHRYALGLRGGYVEAFVGLVRGDGPQVAAGIKAIV
ncbi:MAG: hypothetical protein HYZ27_07750, partial [Deltaproteobacteria bacterium]|nr:hypothetical protein [Deltaproteobacteria bacterium]